MKKLSLPLAFLATLLAACNGTTTPAVIQPVETQVGARTSSVTAEGKLLPDLSVELAFAQGGVIAEVLVKPGDEVAAGDVLARLVGIETVRASLSGAELEILTAQLALDQLTSPSTLATAQKAVAQDEIDLDNAQNVLNDQLFFSQNTPAIENAQAALTLAADKLKTANENYADVSGNPDTSTVKAQAYQTLYAVQQEYNHALWTYNLWSGKNNQQQIDVKAAILAQIKAKLADDQAQVIVLAGGQIPDNATPDAIARIQQAKLNIQLAHARLQNAQDQAEAAKAALELYELRTPIGGTLLSADLKTGETAIPGLPVVFLADTTTWTVETKDLAEIDIARVDLGQSVIIKLDAFPDEEFTGKVTAINPVGNEYLGDMTYKVTITLDKADPRFMWNMTAIVTINTVSK
jgi:multidrug resistance efflux pump